MHNTNSGSGSGRGWHGDSEEHAKVGAMGGRANSKSSQDDENENQKGRKGGRAQGNREELDFEDDQI